jgi:hypothetical protein
MKNTEFTAEDLVGEPESRTLATGKEILSFKVKKSEKTNSLNTGDKFYYRKQLFEIMNRERYQTKDEFLKFNCFVRQEKLKSDSAFCV